MLHKKDLLITVGIFLLALCVRLPYLSQPETSVFDEHFSRVTISDMHHGSPFFDVHPPLSILIWEGVVHDKNFDAVAHGGPKTGVPFDNFPYYRLRLFTVVLGSLLPAVIFLISRLIFIETPLALLPSFFVIFDNAFVIYSRAILSDTMLLFFGFFGIMLWFLSQYVKNKILSVLTFVLATVSWGASASIKWTGLSFLGAVVVCELYRKNIKRIVVGVLCASAVYLGIFALFFVRITGDNINSIYKVDALATVHFSQEKSIKNFSEFFLQYHRAMIQANESYNTHFDGHSHPAASKPYQWPLNQKTLSFWLSQDNTSGIVLAGNFPAWVFGMLSLLSVLVLSTLSLLGYKTPITLPRSTLVLVGGFLISYIPLFFIGRSLFLYHYFSPLLFEYLCVPVMIPFWASIISPKMKTKNLAKIFIIVVIVWYFLFIPQTYGVVYPSLLTLYKIS